MRRPAVALIAVLLGVGAVLVVGVAESIGDEVTCRDLNRGNVAASVGAVSECFAGSTIRRALVAGLLYGCGGLALLAMLAGTYSALRGSRAILFSALAVGALLLFAAAFGAARFQ